ncbi:hypothetical protein [Shewanella polaris]|uniref:Uncharacterized protein n=1 Tax=Shewanella polaris TaxID=2588449 RepID=A0A4Y5YHW5_9GAMM|nr:hypothetical protein [Shewanella polaris]QDE32402.1 hypothetical protein FH971_16380 [Shewanella polaris]
MRKIFFVFALLASIDINATNHPPGYPDDVNFETPIMLFSGSCHSGDDIIQVHVKDISHFHPVYAN